MLNVTNGMSSLDTNWRIDLTPATIPVYAANSVGPLFVFVSGSAIREYAAPQESPQAREIASMRAFASDSCRNMDCPFPPED